MKALELGLRLELRLAHLQHVQRRPVLGEGVSPRPPLPRRPQLRGQLPLAEGPSRRRAADFRLHRSHAELSGLRLFLHQSPHRRVAHGNRHFLEESGPRAPSRPARRDALVGSHRPHTPVAPGATRAKRFAGHSRSSSWYCGTADDGLLRDGEESLASEGRSNWRGALRAISHAARLYFLAPPPGRLVALVVLSRLAIGALAVGALTGQNTNAFVICDLCGQPAFLLLACKCRDRVSLTAASSTLANAGHFGRRPEARTELHIPSPAPLFGGQQTRWAVHQ